MPKRPLESITETLGSPIQGTAFSRTIGRLILALATVLASLLLAFIGFLLFREDHLPVRNTLLVAGLVLVPGVATFAFMLVMGTRLLSDTSGNGNLIPIWLPSTFGAVVLISAIFRLVIAFRGVPFGSMLEAIGTIVSVVLMLWFCVVAHRRLRDPDRTRGQRPHR